MLFNCWVFTARCYAERCYASVSRPSVRLSVCLSICPSAPFGYVFHTGWNNSKIISRLISLRFLFGLTPTREIWSNGTPQKGEIGVGNEHKKPAIYLKRTNTYFRLVPKSMTLDDLERLKRTHAEKRFTESIRKNLN